MKPEFSSSFTAVRPPRGTPVPPASKQLIWQKINRAIAQSGRINYRQLMEIMLYDREEGFYTRHLTIGTREQDHFSTRPVDLSPHYGRAFARKLANFADLLRLKEKPLELVALGDGTGVFLHDILAELKNYPRLNGRLRTTSIELVPRFAEMQRGRLADLGVKVVNGSAVELDRHLAPFSGLVFANELFDQFPVHKIINQAGRAAEVFLTKKNGRIVEQFDGFSDPLIEEYFAVTGKLPHRGDTCVVNLDAFRVLKKLGRLMGRGLFLIIDYNPYGWGLNSVPHPRYGRHRPLDPDNLQSALGRDVTTDVDFSALRMLARHTGFQVLFEVSDAELLAGSIHPNLHRELSTVQVLALAKPGDLSKQPF